MRPDDTEYFANIVGGAKKHGETNFTLEANVPYTIVDKEHPIMQGMSDFTITDEAFFLDDVVEDAGDPRARDGGDGRRRRAPRDRTSGEVVPQIWTYEKSAGAGADRLSRIARSSGCRGTTTRTSRNPQVQPMLLRGDRVGRQAVRRHAHDRASAARRSRNGTGAEAAGRGRGGA